MNFEGVKLLCDEGTTRFRRFERDTSFKQWEAEHKGVLASNSQLVFFYHGNCDDGFGSAWIAYRAMMKRKYQVEYIALHHGHVPYNYDHVKDKHVFFLDFCPNDNAFRYVKQIASSVVVVDHHKTAIEILKDEPDHVHLFSNDFSGCYLTAVYFNEEDTDFVPKLIRHLSDNDLWKHELEGTKEFIAYLRLVDPADYTFEYFDEMNTCLESISSPFQSAAVINPYKIGAMILAQQEVQVKEVMKSAFFFEFPSGEQGMAVYHNAKSIVSRLGEELAKRSKTFGLVLTVDYPKSTVKGSLRSVGDYDVEQLALKYNGGGHKNAAGISLPFKMLRSVYPLRICPILYKASRNEPVSHEYVLRALRKQTSYLTFERVLDGRIVLIAKWPYSEDTQLIIRVFIKAADIDKTNYHYNDFSATSYHSLPRVEDLKSGYVEIRGSFVREWSREEEPFEITIE